MRKVEAAERYRFEDLILDVPTQTLFRGSQEIDLPKLSFELLLALARRALGSTGVAPRKVSGNLWPGFRHWKSHFSSVCPRRFNVWTGLAQTLETTMNRLSRMTLGTALILAGITFGPGALADEGFFLGAAIGSAHLNEDNFFSSDNSRAFKLFGGYEVNDYLAIEAAYIDFDEVAEVVVFSTGSLRAAADGQGLSLAVVPQFPIGRFTLIGKAGVLAWDAERSGRLSVTDNAGFLPWDTSRFRFDRNDNGDGTDLFVGIGARFAITERVSLQLDLDHYEFGSLEADVSLLGLSVRF